MGKVGKELQTVRCADGACAKTNCRTGSTMLHRHHRRHQAMWLGIWKVQRERESKFQAFVDRYHSFDPDDWSRICDEHHAEIHLIYDQIILRDRAETGKRLVEYTWLEAEKLMQKLEDAFFDWLSKDTPGVKRKSLQRIRQNRQNKAQKEALDRKLGRRRRDPLEDFYD